jgi:hypothetical protein
MFEITDEQLLDIASDYGVDIDKANEYKELLLKSQLIGDEEGLCRVLAAVLDNSNPPVMPEGLELPPEMNKKLSDEDILKKALLTVYDGMDESLIDEDVERMLSPQIRKQ